jgi:hypothetical protein
MGQQISAWLVCRSMDRQLVIEEDMLLWLSRGHLKGETESEIKV